MNLCYIFFGFLPHLTVSSPQAVGLEADSGAVSCDQEGSSCPWGAAVPAVTVMLLE